MVLGIAAPSKARMQASSLCWQEFWSRSRLLHGVAARVGGTE